MKCLGKRFFSAILTIIMLTSVVGSSASAAVQSSEYLSGYSASVTPVGGGRIVVTVNVMGVSKMKEIGAKTIFIYESADNIDFHQVACYESDDYPKMMGTGYNFYEDVITHQGKTGYYYLASVYVYAANDNGSDTKHYTTVSKRA